jgi:CDP-glucose 4,6-dehydratase
LEQDRSALEDLVVNTHFWRDKRVLITGHSGFKGSWLCLWLQALGTQVIGYSLALPSSPSLSELARVGEGIVSVDGDIRDLDSLRNTLAEHAPEIVFHMAAQPLVRRSYNDPVGTYEINVMGTVNLLEAVRQSDCVKVVINVTTDKVYENREWEWGYREDEPKGGRDPYSNSKACSELVTSAYRDSFFRDPDGAPALASVRAGNVIGGGDWGEDRLIPDIMRAALERSPLLIRNPDAIRPWQHVLNPLSGYMRLAEALWDSKEYAGGWNFGPDERDVKPVRWIVERVSELWGEPLRWESDGASHPHEAHYLRLDSAKARTRLGWAPIWDLDRALASIVDWCKAYQAGEDVRDLVMKQIDAFMAELPAPSTSIGAS